MKALIQRVSGASVEVNHEIIGKINGGLLVFIGIKKGDEPKDADHLINKIKEARLLHGEGGHFDKSVQELNASLLVVSQFTLYGTMSKGRRPDFSEAMAPKEAEELYEYFVAKCKETGINTETGKFGAEMKVSLINDGPVTLILES